MPKNLGTRITQVEQKPYIPTRADHIRSRNEAIREFFYSTDFIGHHTGKVEKLREEIRKIIVPQEQQDEYDMEHARYPSEDGIPQSKKDDEAQKIQNKVLELFMKIKKIEESSKKSPHDLLKEAREDKLISKKEYDLLKDETPSKIKSRLKSLEVEVSDDDEPVVRATIDKDQYKAKPKPRKKQVAVKEIGHELHTRTRKGKKEPISKEEILNYVKLF